MTTKQKSNVLSVSNAYFIVAAIWLIVGITTSNVTFSILAFTFFILGISYKTIDNKANQNINGPETKKEKNNESDK